MIQVGMQIAGTLVETTQRGLGTNLTEVEARLSAYLAGEQ
jgi:hypothetical protein